ncbi:MAG: S8 family serine peptidase [Phycisphaerales bacterium]|nr:S8 family serine peptidase [Phycisphaerales bacterium]
MSCAHSHRRVPVRTWSAVLVIGALGSGVLGLGAASDPLQDDQWHLNNTGQSGGTPGEDANVPAAWAQGYTGAGVVVNVVDGGVQWSHPDLSAGYLPGPSFDHVDGDSDPSPVGSSDNHGTAVAGVLGARLNGQGGVGVAFDAQFAVQRLIGGPVTDAQIAAALAHQGVFDVITNSWSYTPGWYRDMPGLIEGTILDGIQNGRGGFGSIYVFTAGDAANFAGNANQVRWANWRYTICVGGTDDDGRKTSTSSVGTCILVNAPSGSIGAGITTTDRTGSAGYAAGDYTSSFLETSAAAPIVAGVVALMLEANPNLTWRDVQHILAETADRNDPADSSWFQNSVGNWYSDKYGFGRVNADAAVAAAATWTGVEPEFSVTWPTVVTNVEVPDGSTVGVSRLVGVSGTGINALETVELTVDLDAIRRGDTQIELTSPAGTKSILTAPNADPGLNLLHTFTTYKCWGEPANGTWTVRVIDPTLPSGPGNAPAIDPTFWNSFQLAFHGTAAGEVTQFVLTGVPLTVAEASIGEMQVALTNGALGTVNATLSFDSGDTDLTLTSPSTLTFTPDNWFIPQPVQFFAESDPDNDNGMSIWRIAASGVPDRVFEVTESDGDADLKFVVIGQQPVLISEGNERDIEVRLTRNPGKVVNALVQRTSGDPDLQIITGASLLFNDSNWSFPQIISIRANPDPDFLDGTARFAVTSAEAGPVTFDVQELDVNDVPSFVLDPPGPYSIPEGTTIEIDVTMSANPVSTVFAVAELLSADPDLHTIGDTNLGFTPSNYSFPQTVRLRAESDLDTINGSAIFRVRPQTLGFASLSTTVNEMDDDEDMVVFAESPPIQLVEGQSQNFFVTVNPGSNFVIPGSQRLYWRYDGGDFQSVVMLAVSGTRYRATLPAPSCGDRIEFYVGATGDFTGSLTDPPGGDATPFIALVGEVSNVIDDDFSTDLGWTVSGTINGGTTGPGPWERGDPSVVGTLFNTPPSDFDGSNSCYVTGNGLLAAVSDGQTILTSPTYNLGFVESARLSYARWLTEAFGSPSIGSMQVQASSNNGGSWVTLETVTAGDPGWTLREFELSGFLALTDTFRIRFVVSNSDPLTALEGAIDAVRLDFATCGITCPGDADGSGMIDLDDLQLLLFAFGSTVPPGIGPDVAGADGVVDLDDLQVVLFNFGGVCGMLNHS